MAKQCSQSEASQALRANLASFLGAEVSHKSNLAPAAPNNSIELALLLKMGKCRLS